MAGITVSGPGLDDLDTARRTVEEELELFNRWFSSPQSSGGLGNAPLIGPEKALLRTYLIARLSGRFSPQAVRDMPPLEDDIDLLMG